MARKPKKNYKVLKPVRPNAGVEAEYRARLQRLVDDMSRSYTYFIKAQYRETPPAMALDATPAKELQRELSLIGKRWQKRIDAAAPKLGRWFARASAGRSDNGLRKILKDGGIAVDFVMTKPMRDVLEATVSENVSLIRSIGSEYHTQVEGMVMRSVSAGRDLESLTKDLQARFGITSRRADTIALNQNNIATSSFVRVRQEALGLQAVWLHSLGGKTPRPTHLHNNGKIYDPAVGWHDPDPKVNRRIWPGQLINCRCVSASVVKGFSLD